jgi:hypothetical protein
MDRLPPRQWKRLEARNRRLRLLETYFRTREALGRGEWLGALGLVIRHPAMLGLVLGRVAEKLRRNPGHYTAIRHIALRSSRRMAKGGIDAGQHGRQ